MSLDTVRARWMPASYANQPQARCGHSAVAVDARACWGEEFLVVFGGINGQKDALDDLTVLQCDQEAWFAPEKAAVGPAARAFHAAAVIGPLMFLFGGHVYVRQQHKLVQFNDLWSLNTDTWEWSRLSGDDPHAPQPCARDRASMVAVGTTQLLVVGGADSQNRRLDDAWLFDLESGAWSEVKVSGPKPRARCCAALFAVENRVLLFGGDAYGVTNDLWSLRGLDGDGPAHWTQLQLEGPAPPPRRGHAVAATGSWVVFVGGLTEQRSLMGMKSRTEFLADVVILDRRDRVAWRSVELASPPPAPREKHSLTALSGGRLLLFGGTDGTSTLGDAWWLDLEDITPPQPDLLTPAEVTRSAEMAPPPLEATAAPPLPLLPGKPSTPLKPPVSPGGLSALSPAAPDSGYSSQQGAAVQQQAAQQAQLAQQQQSPLSGAALTGGLAYLQQNISMPTLTSALSSLRGRLGLPPVSSASQLAAQQLAAGVSAEADPGLMELGRRAVAASSSDGTAGGALDARQLAAAARRYLATCAADQLQLGDLPVLMADYRRLARFGWSLVLRERGAEALSDVNAQMPGRFMHLSAEDLRMREVPEVLADYQILYASHASLAEAGPTSNSGGAAAAARPESTGA